MKTALENLMVVLKDESTISPYEMCSSGLVQALFTVLNNVGHLSFISRPQLVCPNPFRQTEPGTLTGHLLTTHTPFITRRDQGACVLTVYWRACVLTVYWRTCVLTVYWRAC